jgi:hypothetical protein
VNARVSIGERQGAADTRWQVLSAGRTNPIQVGDEGFVNDEGSAVVVRTRAGNAVAIVRFTAAAGASGRAHLSEAAGEVAEDVLDDLVPR